MSIFLKSYIIFWVLWFVIVQTLGRVYSLHSAALIFDALAVIFIWKFAIKKIDEDSSFYLKDLFDSLPNVLKWIICLLFASLLFTVVFQLPLDWDGMDYHLPPVIEAWLKDRWIRPENPYFAAKNFPKTDSILALWWLEHLGGLLGLRLSLLIPFLHFVAGLFASLLLVGRSKWVLLFWFAYPLAAREGVSFYSDLPALSLSLCFFYFLRKDSVWFAALALGLHSSIKFTNIMSAAFILIFTLLWLYFSKKENIAALLKKGVIIGLTTFLFLSVQPLENYFKDGRLFGPLKCIIMGKDLCGGTINPPDLIVSPTVPSFQKEDSFLKKIATGWLPSQIVPGSDAPYGGFGLAFIPAFLMFLFTLRKRKFDYTVGIFTVMFATEVLIPGLWYTRYHMGLGWVFAMGAALYLEENPVSKNITKATIVLLAVQMLWLVPQRQWFLGSLQSENTFQTVFENIAGIVKSGIYAHATNEADKRHVQLYANKNSTIHICGDELRPVLSAYGATLTNNAIWYKPRSGVPVVTDNDFKGLKQCPFNDSKSDMNVGAYTEVWKTPQ